MTLKINRWDSAEHLHTKEDMARYFAACIEEAAEDTAFIVESLSVLARVKGMTEFANAAGLDREYLDRVLSGDANLSFDTVMKVMRALGLQLQASPLKTQSAA
jgi:probable addiction module antidote protein